jgi:carbamoyl-phosphate synthase small subunit
MDYGVKENMIRCLQERGCQVTVYPAHTPAETVLEGNFDGVMLSNGPGDPADNVAIIAEVRKLYDAGLPIFAVCLGHQLMALATGAATRKMRFGHRGANHPVKDLAAGRVFITSQNHGYVVTAESVDPAVAQAPSSTSSRAQWRACAIKSNVCTVQFTPSIPGPQDTEYLFDRFVSKMEGGAW